MDVVTGLLSVVGLVGLVVGADWLVRGASRLALSFGISPLVVGLTVVAFGTSAPELAVSVQGALAGKGDVALGNVVGSNIFNVLAILGISALVAPLVVAQQVVRLEVPLMIGASLAVLLMGLDGELALWEGASLAGAGILYTIFTLRQSRRESAAVKEEYRASIGTDEALHPSGDIRAIALNLMWVVLGLVLLVFGSRWLVQGAVALAQWMGVSDLMIALTVISAGTSLPEVATSVVASYRGERDIAVGNVVGSNLFNIFVVLGLTVCFAGGDVAVSELALRFDIPVMIGVAVACLPIFFTGHIIARWEGILFLSYYLLYLAFLILRSTDSELLGPVATAVGVFVLPLTGITLGIFVWRQVKKP